jgi:hypothetical protein
MRCGGVLMAIASTSALGCARVEPRASAEPALVTAGADAQRLGVHHSVLGLERDRVELTLYDERALEVARGYLRRELGGVSAGLVASGGQPGRVGRRRRLMAPDEERQ